MRDFRDIAIDQLADDEATMLDCLTTLTAERDGYRLLAQQAIHLLHKYQGTNARMREQNHHLLDEMRALRASSVRAA